MSAVPAEIPIFSRQSIAAMSPIAQHIAKLLDDEKYIKIIDGDAKKEESPTVKK